jgi:hypothetical protein
VIIKPGIMALTFGAPIDNGLLVEVIEPSCMHRVFGQLWHVRSLGSSFHITPTRRSQTAAWPGCMLRPIGNPGPDAVDETLVGKPAPVLEEVSA